MKERDLLVEIERRLARRAAGLNPRTAALYPAQGIAGAYEADLLALPETTSATPLVDLSGALLFMLDFSPLDGPDPLA